MAGNAWSLHDDLARGWAIYPDAPVIAVNGAAGEVKAIALYSKHPERFSNPGWQWAEYQQRRFGGGFTVHSSNQVGHPTAGRVEFWWEDARGGGGSAWGARKLAWLMGFEPVVMCGCPLVAGNYASHKPGVLMAQDVVINRLRRQIEAEPEWHDGVSSMSGWTREFFGC